MEVLDTSVGERRTAPTLQAVSPAGQDESHLDTHVLPRFERNCPAHERLVFRK